ncbi:hypothetical protein PROFUN_02898 [Planoprotostelium fungivorum]|uniref:Heme haloperoxidase family profile domain-containing protein n=1 Tax=Planoprotostelium fungivorum TaxID=1890364 RepID=A0A2P6NS07_9EUKA|nr:hypothetical protein PROFUN_02898 [Planoprotostelium fungivorum]
MRTTLFVLAALLVVASAFPRGPDGRLLIVDDHSFQKPVKGAYRSPCPALNTLANHGFLPRDGKNITKENIIQGLFKGLNVGRDIGVILANAAFKKFGATNSISMLDLQQHNMIEHDASMTRSDNALGDSTVVNATLLQDLISSSDGVSLTWRHMVAHRRRRQDDCKKNNPRLVWNEEQKQAAAGEVVIFQLVFGDWLNGVSLPVVRSIFAEEKFPAGWKPHEGTILAVDVLPRQAILCSCLVDSADVLQTRDFAKAARGMNGRVRINGILHIHKISNMRTTLFVLAALLVVASAFPRGPDGRLLIVDDDHSFQAPAAGAYRSPCPALNTLANHGFLPRDGKNITKSDLIQGLFKGLNVGRDIGFILANAAFKKYGATDSISMLDLQQHNMIEHDCSMTRNDNALGDSTVVNATLLEDLIYSSTDGLVITWKDMVAHRRRRQDDSKAKNPSLVWNEEQKQAAAGEVVIFQLVFGEWGTGVPIYLLRSILGEERFPEDWQPHEGTVLAVDVLPRQAIVRIADGF